MRSGPLARLTHAPRQTGRRGLSCCNHPANDGPPKAAPRPATIGSHGAFGRLQVSPPRQADWTSEVSRAISPHRPLLVLPARPTAPPTCLRRPNVASERRGPRRSPRINPANRPLPVAGATCAMQKPRYGCQSICGCRYPGTQRIPVAAGHEPRARMMNCLH